MSKEALKIQVREAGDARILDLHGKLRAGDEAIFRDAVDRLLENECKMIVVETAGLTRLDSVGIGEIIAGLKRVRSSGGQMKIVTRGPTRNIWAVACGPWILEAELFETEEDALATFRR